MKLHLTEDFRESAQAFIEELQMAFFSFGERDHDIAVIKVPDDQPVGSSRLAHTALEIEGGQEQLRQLYERLKRYGAKVEFTADHVLTKSVYFFDPDGTRPEMFCEMMDPESGMTHMREGVNLSDRSYKPEPVLSALDGKVQDAVNTLHQSTRRRG